MMNQVPARLMVSVNALSIAFGPVQNGFVAWNANLTSTDVPLLAASRDTDKLAADAVFVASSALVDVLHTFEYPTDLFPVTFFRTRDSLDPEFAHEAGDLVAPDVVAGALGGLPQLVRSVDLPVRDPQREQNLQQDRVPDRAGRRHDLPLLRGVVGARSHLQVLADELDSELAAVFVDERDDHLDGRSSSAAKKAEARFSRSLARRSSRLSLLDVRMGPLRRAELVTGRTLSRWNVVV
jgi:hypothetical protein